MENLLKIRNYYALKSEETLSKLKTSSNGITDFEAQGRLELAGENVLPRKRKVSSFRLFLRQFNSPLIFIIIFAAIFSYIAGHSADAIFIFIVVFINTTVGFFQEKKAEKALEKLESSVKFYCRVIREGRKKNILNKFLVPGDIVELRAGDKVPADGRLIFSKGLKINESSLTGEWMAMEKNVEPIKEDVVVSDQKNMVFMGTIVEEGRAHFVVTGTGIRTEVGKISNLVKEEKETKTPIQKKFKHISKILGAAILIAVAIFSLVYIWRGEDLYTVFITSIALVVSAIPEGLLPAVTVILVLGMRRLAKKKALVRKLNATEGMGSVSVICMDKTGTLTKGEMAVSHILSASEELLEIKDISNTDKKLKHHMRVVEIATMVQDAYIENPEDEFSDWTVQGSPTEKALLLAGIGAGIIKEDIKKDLEVLENIEFDSDKKYAANVYKSKEDESIFSYVMGSPEKVISMSDHIDRNGNRVDIGSQEFQSLMEKVEDLTSRGLRVLACGYKKAKNEKEGRDMGGFSLVGFVALKDPLRENVSESVEIATRAGIKPIIITGDHKNTAKAIVEEIGVDVKESEILEGKDLEKMSDQELEKRVNGVSIFARVIPKHKIRIVRAIQENEEIVAMVGDGTNDAPALKAADIGIAVGTGTDIAKEVSDIVLTDNSFSVIINAIEQGRLIKDNIRRVLVYLVADDFSELFLFFTVLFFGMPFPLYPVQILWINLVEDSFPDIALTTEKDTTGLMDKKVDPKEPLLSKGYKKFIFSVFLVSGIAAFLIFYLSFKLMGDLDKARTMTFTLIAFDSLAFAFIVRSFRQSVFSKKAFSNKILNWAILMSAVILVLGIYVPVLQDFLKVVPLAISDWGIIIGVTLVELLILEWFKVRFLVTQKNTNSTW